MPPEQESSDILGDVAPSKDEIRVAAKPSERALESTEQQLRKGLMTSGNHTTGRAVDVVIPVYRERSKALAETLSACLKQTHPIARALVVDDGSPEPVELPEWATADARIVLLRLAANSGISAARNFGVANSNAPFLACVNTEVLPDSEWLAVCLECLSNNATAGACYTRLVSATPKRLLSRWRMRFLEAKFGEEGGPADFAPGHAVLFRREALTAVGGYDVRYRLHHEDSDICHRMRKAGWQTFYVATSRCVSVQKDTLKQIATKELRESYWYSPAESSLARLYLRLSKWTLIRAIRNLLKGRLYFLPLDVAIWACGLWIATCRTLMPDRRPTNES